MATPTAVEVRRALETLRAEATRLLVEAEHDSLKEQIRFAMRDLDEAELWLQKQPRLDRPALSSIVPLVIETAMWRLTMVREALAKDGPGSSLLW